MKSISQSGYPGATGGEGKPKKKEDILPNKRLSLEEALKLQAELIDAFSEKEFQQRLKIIDQRLSGNKGQLSLERGNHFLSVQSKILPKYGFLEGQRGVAQMVEILQRPPLSLNAEIIKNNDHCNRLLGIGTPTERGEGKGGDGEVSPTSPKHVTVTVKHAIKTTESVKVTVDPDSTLLQVKEIASHKLGRPDIAKKAKIVKKSEETGYFSGAKETTKLGTQRVILLLGVDDLKATRQVPNIGVVKATELLRELAFMQASEIVQRGFLHIRWETQGEDLPKKGADVGQRAFKSILPGHGFEGSKEGWKDFQNMIAPYCSNEEFLTLYEAVRPFIEEHTITDDMMTLLREGGASVFTRPEGGVYVRKNMGQPVPSLATGEVFALRSAQRTGERWTAQPSLVLTEKRQDGKPTVIVDTSVRYQTLLGFGGSFTETSANLFYQMSHANQARLVDACYDPSVGLGYYLGRTHINSCDFSVGEWTCCDREGDTALHSFSIDRYRKNIIPLIRQSQDTAGGSILLIASPWSPPKWMKDNDTMLSGGRLKPHFRDVWARWYVKFAKEFEAQGLPVWAVTVQNEPMAQTPWENCLYTTEEEKNFVRDFLGPALKKSGLDIKLLVWDHNREDMLARARAIYADPVVADYVWGVAFHWYGDPRYESWVDKAGMLCYDNVRAVHELRPEKHLVMTEACQEGGPHTSEWQVGERYAENIIKDLNNWTEAWVDWNLWLDKKGGPNHVGNFCSAPILVDPEKDLVLFQPAYYFIGHFSRYVQPGAERIMCASSRDVLETTAFANPDGTIVCVVLNQGNSTIDFWLEIQPGKAANAVASPHSISTYIFRC